MDVYNETTTPVTDVVSPVSVGQLFLWFFGASLILLFTLPYLPNKRSRIRFNARFALYYILVSTMAIICIPFFLILNPKDVSNSMYASYVLRYIANLLGMKYELRNPDILRENKGCVVVANHQSTFDILGMFNFWDVFGRCTVIAKRALFYVWPFGLSAYLGGVVFIDRSNKKAAFETLKITSELMVNHGTKIWIFPEGTRNTKGNGSLLEFKKGAFVTAVAGQVPIIPVVYSPYYFIDHKTNFFDTTGRVIITALEPVPTKGLTENDIPDLINIIKQKMEKVVKELYNEVTETLPPNYPECVQ